MSLSPEAAAQLSTYSQVAVGFAGFAGVIGAFSRFRMHAQATAFRVRAMVGVALMEVIFSLLPPLVSGFGAGEALTWRICAGLLAVVTTGLLLVMVRQASILYRVGRLMRNAAYLLSAVGVVVIVPLYATAAGVTGSRAPATYFAMMFFGMALCSYHFILLMVAVQLDESEEVSAPAATAPSGGDPGTSHTPPTP